MASTVLVLLSPLSGNDAARLVDALARVDGAVVMTREPDPPSNGPTVPAAPPADFAVAAVLDGDSAAALEETVREAQTQIDPARSAVLAGTDHEIMPTPPMV